MSKYAIIRETRSGVATKKLATKQPPTTTKDKQARSGSTEHALEKVQGMIDEWQSYRKKMLPIWERDTKLYNNERHQKSYEGLSDTFVPMTFSTIETMVSALATGDLSTEFVPQDIYEYLRDRFMEGYDENDEFSEEEFIAQAIRKAIDGGVIEDETLDVLNALYDYYWDCGDWDLIIEKFIRSGLKLGNGAMWEVWEHGKPKLIFVPFPDFVFDPAASDDDSARFSGRRYLASLKDMKKEKIVDPETGKLKKRFDLSALEKQDKKSKKEERTDKEMKEQMLFGSTLDKEKSDQVEVIELRTPEKSYTVVNRTCLAENVENPILAQAKLRKLEQHQIDNLILIPHITWSNYQDESLLMGKSETSTFWKEQERLNDATNQKSDAVTRALLQQYQADPQLKDQATSFSVPGAVIWGTAGQFHAIPPAQVPAAAFTEEVSIKNNIRETTATDQIVKGVGSNGDVTATEANLQVASSGQRMEMKITSLARGPLKRLARLTLQYIRLFVTDPFLVPQKANGGLSVLFYDPAKYSYEYEPKVTLTISAQNKRRREQTDALGMYQILIQDPTNNLEEVKKVMLPKIVDLDKDQIKRIMTPVQEAAPEMPAAQPTEQELPDGQL